MPDASTTPISPASVTTWKPDDLPAYLSNGCVGLRVGPVPLLNGTAIVNGFEGRDPEADVEAFSPAPYPLFGDITVGRVSLGASPERARLSEQRYDFATGELHTTFDFDAPDARLRARVLTFCSRTVPSIVAQQLELTVDRACTVEVRMGVDQTSRVLSRDDWGRPRT